MVDLLNQLTLVIPDLFWPEIVPSLLFAPVSDMLKPEKWRFACYNVYQIWTHIASDMLKVGQYTVSRDQCDTKWKNLKATYKEILTKNSKSGRGRETWEIFDVRILFTCWLLLVSFIDKQSLNPIWLACHSTAEWCKSVSVFYIIILNNWNVL